MFVASCTSTGDAPIQLANPAFNGMGPAATLLADVAAEEGSTDGTTEAANAQPASAEGSQPDASATAQGDATTKGTAEGTLPVEVAYLPASRPGAAGDAAAATEQEETAQATAEPPADATPVASTEAEPRTTPAPQQFASAAPTRAIATAAPAPKKKGFLASFFGRPSSEPADASPAQSQLAAQTAANPRAADEPKPLVDSQAAPTPLIEKTTPKPLITLASAEPRVRRSANLASLGNDDGALPGVRQSALFEITRKSGLDDDSDVDLYEGEHAPPVRMASAAGFARLAPNGLLKQRESVDVACLKPSLVRMLKSVERRYGRKIVVTSGYRSPTHNRKVRGARNSMHMYCAAADVQIEGVSKWELARFVRSMPGRGGVGTYCHTESVHIDVGPERDWNWRCRRRKA